MAFVFGRDFDVLAARGKKFPCAGGAAWKRENATQRAIGKGMICEGAIIFLPEFEGLRGLKSEFNV